MSDLLFQQAASGWHQSFNRSDFGRISRSEELVAQIMAPGGGYIHIQGASWDQYWGPVKSRMRPGELKRLDALKQRRVAYIKSGYVLEDAIPYCHAYFDLLRSLLVNRSSTSALRLLLGLECFRIMRHADESSCAAGVITVRHPVYMLAKLREPGAYDDPKFLPVVSPCNWDDPDSTDLFYHYRQVKVHGDPPASLLMYPAIDLAERANSFSCIDSVSSSLRYQSDPRSRNRAQAIADWAIAPFMRHEGTVNRDSHEFAFVDLGGGSGSLLGEVSKRLLNHHGSLIAGRKFAWSIVDLGLQDATRRTHNPELRRLMSYIDYAPAPYKSWIEDERVHQGPPKYDVVLICRLLNNLSKIALECASSQEAIVDGVISTDRNLPVRYHPADCLHKSCVDRGTLIASNARVKFGGGTTFRQASVSDYFKALYQLSNARLTGKLDKSDLYYPVRRFNQDSIFLPDGTSIFSALVRLANLIVIEDVDLSPDILREHLQTHSPGDLAASDATDRMRMQSASLLCVTRRGLASALPGRRIW